MQNKIKRMVEDGFPAKRIASRLNLIESEVKNIINDNKFSLKTETFKESEINKICELYKDGVSAKQLGYKYNIDKRRIQKWAASRGQLRLKNDSHRFTNFNENIFDKIDTSAKAYWLGFFYADAYNSDKTNTFCLTLCDNDFNHLVKLSNFVGLPIDKIISYEFKNKSRTNKIYRACSLKLYSKHICQVMTKLGCPRAKSFTITYPDWMPKELHSHFIRGMFDGDGCLTYRKNQKEWKWSLASTDVCCNSIKQILLNEIGLNVNYRNISLSGRNTCELESSGNEKITKIMNWLYIDSSVETRLDRKYDKFLDLNIHQKNRTFKRKAYMVSVEEQNKIEEEIKDGYSIEDLSSSHKVHPRTIAKINKNNQYKFDKIVTINNEPITTKYVKTLDYDERMALVEPLFNHFRDQGWLYPDNPGKLKANYKKLCDFKPDLSSIELFNNSSMATDICKYFCHKFYDATEVGKVTMKEVFQNDDKLRYLIKNRLGFDWWDKEDNDETFNISFRMLIQGMRSSRLVPSISIFKPNIAKYMYMKYSEPGDVVFDYSAGWGGRMLGAASCGRKYIGVDPLTTDELQVMADYFELKDITLINNGSEHVKLDENSVDFSFSSPPYFNQEFYIDDITQAYAQGEDYFYDEYWAKTMDNVKYMLKPGKIFGLNILRKYDRMIDMAKARFGEPIEEIQLRTIKSHLGKNMSTGIAGIQKHEPIFIFRNEK